MSLRQHISEYEVLELQSMNIIARMLFPRDYNLWKSWVLKRSFVAMDYLQRKLRSSDEFGDFKERNEYIGSVFSHFIQKYNGWLCARDSMFIDSCSNINDITMTNAVKGFVTGHILKTAINNKCSIIKASEYVFENIAIEKYMRFLDRKLVFDSISLVDSENIRKHHWYNYDIVSHMWAAAVDIFEDPSNFTNRMMYVSHPFEDEDEPQPGRAGFEHFLILGKDYYEHAVSAKDIKGRRSSPLIDKHINMLFDLV